MITYVIKQLFPAQDHLISKFMCVDNQYSNSIADALMFKDVKQAKGMITQYCNDFPGNFQTDFIVEEYSIKYLRKMR